MRASAVHSRTEASRVLGADATSKSALHLGEKGSTTKNVFISGGWFLLNLGTLGSKTACLKSARQWPTAWERRAAMGVRRRGDAGGASADSPSDHESGSEHEESGAEDELGGQEDPETERTVRGYGIGKENMLFRRLMVEDGEPAGPSSRAPILSTRPTRACIVTTASSASCLRKEIRRRSTAQTR